MSMTVSVLRSLGRLDDPPDAIATQPIAGELPPGWPDLRDDGLGDYSEGRYLWYLKDIQPVNPSLLVTGHQGWWNWEPT